MKNIISKEEFIRRANERHNFKYDYSLVDFVNLNTKVIIICKEHGVFTQRANVHCGNKPQGCRKCNQPRPNLLSKEEFILRSNLKHNYKYDYSLVEYKDSRTNVKIICKEHGVFEQNPQTHYTQSGCKKCVVRMGKSKDYYINKANEKHNYKYDYSLLPDTLKSNDEVSIICEKGHIFKQKICDHIGSVNGRSNGCKFCSMPCYDKESFIKLSNERHGNKYDYSKTVYKTQRDKVIITCPKHGDFLQKPSNHYHLMRGCSRCGESKGELEIRKWLESKNIIFEKEKTFEDCLNVGRLRFDFWLPDYKTCIEFDGLQHFKAIKQFGGQEDFEKTKQRDLIKNKYCKDNDIKLIRINYKNLKRGDISEVLDKTFSDFYDIKEKI
jgi:very-short-patch-repair endonuclease